VNAARDVELSNELINVARQESDAHEGPYYEAHVAFLQALVSTVQRGGSIICESEAAEHAIQVTSEIPDAVLNGVEEGWVEMVRSASEGNIGLVVPPFVSILLSRCARRGAILPVLRDMKAEYADGRNRIWDLMNELRNVTSIARAREIRHELEEAARAMNPQNEWPEFFPVRALWKLVMAVVGGAVVGQIAGGHPGAGAAVGAVNQAREIMAGANRRAIFAGGVFDLARRINRDLRAVPRMPELLRPLLTQQERERFGI